MKKNDTLSSHDDDCGISRFELVDRFDEIRHCVECIGSTDIKYDDKNIPPRYPLKMRITSKYGPCYANSRSNSLLYL